MPIELPDVRQTGEYDCGHAAIDCALLALGLAGFGPVRLANPVDGMPPDTLESILRSLNLRVLSGQMTAADLRFLTDSGRPVICPVSLHGGHWVVVGGVRRGRVSFQCPVAGPSSLPAAGWDAVWTDRSRTSTYVNWGVAVAPSA